MLVPFDAVKSVDLRVVEAHHLRVAWVFPHDFCVSHPIGVHACIGEVSVKIRIHVPHIPNDLLEAHSPLRHRDQNSPGSDSSCQMSVGTKFSSFNEVI